MQEAGGKISELSLTAERLGCHDHLCLIYETQEEQFSIVIPFIKAGLERGEQCLYIVDDNTAAEVMNAMSAEGIDVERFQRDGSLAILSKKEAYLKQEVFDPDWMIDFLKVSTDVARAQGYSALRIAGEMTWALGNDPGVEKLIEYEAKLNRFFPYNDALAVCQYNYNRFSPEIIIDVLRTHPLVIFKDKICRNFYYVPPEEFLVPEQKKREVERLLQNIVARARVEELLQKTNEELESKIAERTGELTRTNEMLKAQIAERLDVEKALRRSEEQFRTAVTSAPIVFFILDQNGTFLMSEGSGLKNLGLMPGEVVGKSVFDIYESRPEITQNIRRALRGEKSAFIVEVNGIWYDTKLSPIRSADGEPSGLIGVATDVTGREKALQKVEQANESLQIILDAMPYGVMIVDKKRNIRYANSAAFRLAKCDTPEDLVGKTCHDLLCLSEDHKCPILDLGQKIDRSEHRFKKKDGTVIPILKSVAVVSVDGEEVLLEAFVDITEITKTKEALEHSLQEKELLIKEVYHRIKNNLMVVQSLLMLQSREIKDSQTRSMFHESQSRVMAMSMIHERLYRSRDLLSVDFREYLTSLIGALFDGYNISADEIDLKINVPPVSLDVDSMIPLGLIINEIISNALKHAFLPGKGGELFVQLQESSDNKYLLIIKDNGVGISEGRDILHDRSMGMTIVTSLVRQIEGNIELVRDNGTEFRIEFKEKQYR